MRTDRDGDAALTTTTGPQPNGTVFTVGFQGSTVATRSIILNVT